MLNVTKSQLISGILLKRVFLHYKKLGQYRKKRGVVLILKPQLQCGLIVSKNLDWLNTVMGSFNIFAYKVISFWA